MFVSDFVLERSQRLTAATPCYPLGRSNRVLMVFRDARTMIVGKRALAESRSRADDIADRSEFRILIGGIAVRVIAHPTVHSGLIITWSRR